MSKHHLVHELLESVNNPKTDKPLPVIIGIIADCFDHYRWAKDIMERNPLLASASFQPLLKEHDLRGTWRILSWVLDYRVNYTNTSDIVYYNCKRLSVPIKDKYEVVREYNLRF